MVSERMSPRTVFLGAAILAPWGCSSSPRGSSSTGTPITMQTTPADDADATQRVGGGDLYDQPGPDGWSEPHAQNYPSDPPVTLHGGSNLSFSCTYHNTTAQTFVFGQSAATNEMCILHGMYWPRLDRNTEQCTNGTSSGDTPIPLGM